MRNYLFLYHWAWYEWLGALAPLVLFWLLWRFARKRGETLLARFALAVFALRRLPTGRGHDHAGDSLP